MFDFINDLDEYFCEKYANYDKLCVLNGYKMPVMHASEVRADGRTYAYTLPSNTMRLALQENKAELLKTLKQQLFDKTFSFSFRPLRLFSAWKNKSSKYGFVKIFRLTMAKYNTTPEKVGEDLAIAPEIWKKICKGSFLPTKNVLFSLALTAHLSLDDLKNLLTVCGFELDFTFEKDVVMSYLVGEKVFNPEMVKAALAEYKVDNLFIKTDE